MKNNIVDINIFRIKKHCKNIIEEKEQVIKDIVALSDHLYIEDDK